MATFKIYRSPIWRNLPHLIKFLCSKRKGLKESEKAIRAGLNFSIILNSACFVEGTLETGLKALLLQRRLVLNEISSPSDFYTRRTINMLFNNIKKDLEKRITRATGIDEIDEIFKLLINQKISEFEKVKPLWEGMQILFHFRNVLAHGKEVSAFLEKSPKTQGIWEESFSGGYKKAQDYLLKNKLLRKSFFVRHSKNIFFTDRIANHFRNLSIKFIKTISNSLSSEEKRAFDEAVFKRDIFLKRLRKEKGYGG